MEQITSTVTERAYSMAELWATDKERLAAMLTAKMQPAEFAEICGYLADAFASVVDECVSMERSSRDCFTAISMIRGVVVERVMLPDAERLAKTDHDEDLFALGWAPVQIANAERAERRAA